MRQYSQCTAMRAVLAFLFFIQVALCESVVHETRQFDLDDDNVIDRRRVQADTPLPMRIGLRQNGHALANAEQWLMAVSEPDSPKFGQHWTQAKVIEAFKPSDESVQAVIDWLSQHGITHVTHSENKQWIAFDLAASVAEALLQTEYFEHQTNKGSFEVSCDEYSLPEELREHVDYVTPGVKSKNITGRSRRSREYFAARQSMSYSPSLQTWKD